MQNNSAVFIRSQLLSYNYFSIILNTILISRTDLE